MDISHQLSAYMIHLVNLLDRIYGVHSWPKHQVHATHMLTFALVLFGLYGEQENVIRF